MGINSFISRATFLFEKNRDIKVLLLKNVRYPIRKYLLKIEIS